MIEWHGCYDESWKDIIVPEAFAHPAKFSRALIRRIYDYMLAEGYIQAGDVIVDPFGGVALGGLDAMINGLQWVGCELEQRFVDLGNQNIEKWKRDYPDMLPGIATLLQGDSRQLSDVIREAGGLVSSPPYADQSISKNSVSIDREKQYATYKSSGGGQSFYAFCKTQELHSGDYGTTPGQLGAQNVDTFWLAAREIVTQCYSILRPGAYAAWVVKGYVKNKQLVDFPGQWRQLCESCGFEFVEEVHASLVKETHVGHDLFSGEKVTKKVERKSFFRRLAESSAQAQKYWKQVDNKESYLARSEKELVSDFEARKDTDSPAPKVTGSRILSNAKTTAWKDAGSPYQDIDTRIDFETVLFMQKPGVGGGNAVISSPPYSDSINSGQNGIDLSLASDPRDRRERNDHSNVAIEQRYGTTPGQLGSMKSGNIEDVI